MLSQTHHLSAYAATQDVMIPEHTPLLLVIQIPFQQCQMAEYQPETINELIKAMRTNSPTVTTFIRKNVLGLISLVKISTET